MNGEELLTITYKNKQYSFKELSEENNSFSKKLKLPERLSVRISRMEWALGPNDYGFMIATEKFQQLYSLLATARFALTQAHQKIHKSPVTWSSGYMGQMWLRVQYLKNAIIWYNSCDDYLLQIIWFAFDFLKMNDLSTKESYQEELKKIRWVHVTDKLEKITDKQDVVDFLKSIKAFRKDKNRLKANNLANSLKHHANIEFKGLYAGSDGHISSYLGFDSTAIEPEMLDIDEVCLLLSEVHQSNIVFAEYLLDFINFKGAFPPEVDGVIHMDNKIPRETYKKFWINE